MTATLPENSARQDQLRELAHGLETREPVALPAPLDLAVDTQRFPR